MENEQKLDQLGTFYFSPTRSNAVSRRFRVKGARVRS
jgi:hypothetical protein